jgi:hypothetical protein
MERVKHKMAYTGAQEIHILYIELYSMKLAFDAS